MKFGSAFKEIREIKKLSIEDVSKNINFTVEEIENLESLQGHKEMNASLARAYAKHLNISKEVFQFFCIEESDVPEDKRPLFNTIFPSLKGILQAALENESEIKQDGNEKEEAPNSF